MKLTKFIFIITLLTISFSSFSQDVKFKKGIVYIDGKECMKYDSDSQGTTFYDLEGDEIMFLKFMGKAGVDLYNKVGFTSSKETFTSQSFIFSRGKLIDKLIKAKAIQDCGLVAEKVTDFVFKHDEKVEDQTTSTQTIIIKEEPRKSGININIGN